MIVCPNCNHQNPDAAVQCEACYTPLPAMMDCPHCGASVQADASFCGQCGFNLQSAEEQSTGMQNPQAQSAELQSAKLQSAEPQFENLLAGTLSPDFEMPSFSSPESAPLMTPEPLVASSANGSEPLLTGEVAAQPVQVGGEGMGGGVSLPNEGSDEALVPAGSAAQPAMSPTSSKTQLQTQVVRLLHVQTNTPVELPANLAVIHIGKPNDRIPPDVDVSGFPHSEIVSRIHADIRVEGDIYYIEDVGSSNGTYINNAPLPSGNRHRLRPGDRIALGKGDKVTFLFQIS